MICDACGYALQVGDYPFCHGDAAQHVRQAASVNGDECDFVVENGFRRPQRFRSKAAHREALAAQGLELHVEHRVIPGTDKSPYTSDWSKGSIDPYTLAAAEALVTRNGTARATAPTPEPLMGTWTVRELPRA